MSKNTSPSAEIAGTGMYVPERILTNAELEQMVETTDEWIRVRTGIRERRIAADEEASSDMAVRAARAAVASARIEVDELEMIIVATSTPDMLFPSTACFVQKHLGAARAVAYDISAVCSGFVFGLSIAEQFIKSGRYKTILLVGSEAYSRIIDWKDRQTCILFGDGAGAMVLRRGENAGKSGLLSTHIYSDGAMADLVQVPGGIGRHRICHDAIDRNQYVVKMKGGSTFKIAVKRMAEVAVEALRCNGFSLDDVGMMIPHQANKRIIDAVAEKLRLPAEKTFVNIDKYGNTSAASIPIAVHEARECGKIKPGDLVLLTVLGAGLTWGAALIRW
ncbi:MAG: beta-ketoacyl-ACP synthase III [Nitrospinales bacterium]